MSRVARALAALAPGVLVAATGVGAGDLATAAFAGSHLGTAVLWAVVVGAALKLVLNEGLARWQLASGETWLEGALTRLGPLVRWLFLGYLLLWSWFVGSALMSACGVTAHALVPAGLTPERGKQVYGVAHAVVGLVLVWFGGFRLFERVMSVCIAVMFVTVLVTAALLRPDWGAVARGLVVPTIPDLDRDGLGWTLALMGGVGGTLTVICYGYWIRELGRTGPADLPACRLDLAGGYAMTALFGLAMVVIGARVEVTGKGAGLVAALADTLAGPLGPAARLVFLLGAWGAVFSSLLGVWQAVPYVFADLLRIARRRPGPVDTRAPAYRGYLVALALVPTTGLVQGFQSIQKAYAVIGAAFLPFLAASLLVLNGRRGGLADEHRNRPLTVVTLAATCVFFVGAGVHELLGAG